jgi:hypothetical protein
MREDLLTERLRGVAFWLVFGAFVTLLWAALPAQAAGATLPQGGPAAGAHAPQCAPYANSRIARTSAALVNGRGLRCTGS